MTDSHVIQGDITEEQLNESFQLSKKLACVFRENKPHHLIAILSMAHALAFILSKDEEELDISLLYISKITKYISSCQKIHHLGNTEEPKQ